MNKTIKNKKGITLIALVITIVVLLVLAVVAIRAVTGEDGIIKRAQQTKFLSDIGQYKEELELYKTNWAIEYQLNNRATTDEINDPSQINTWDYDEIKEKYIKSFAKKYKDKIGIKNGELVYQYIDNETEREWAEQSGLGIESEEITIEVGAEGLGTVSSSIEIKDGKIATKKGQTITITAAPGTIGEGENTLVATFKGWYNGETLITDKLSYTFKVAGSETLTAIFETDATLIYYLDENGEETVLLDSTTNLSTYERAYISKTKITKVEFGTKCTTIYKTAFKDCTNMKLTELPPNLTTIGANAFENCTNITITEIPSTCISIGASAFRNTGITTIVGNTTSTITIDNIAFRNCSKLTSAKFTNVKLNGGECFGSCANLTSLELGMKGNGVSSLGSNTTAWDSKKLVTKVYLSDLSLRIDTKNTNATIYYYDEEENLIDVSWGLYYSGDTSIENVEIPDVTSEIRASAFLGCTKLKLTKLPSNLKSIGNNAFENCTNIAITEIPSTCTSIGIAAFRRSGLTTIEGNTISTIIINAEAFRNCSKLTSAKFTNVELNGNGECFGSCNNLITLELGMKGKGLSSLNANTIYWSQNNQLIVKVYLSDLSLRIDTKNTNATIYYYNEEDVLLETVVCGQ